MRSDHPDYVELKAIASGINRQAGGEERLQREVPVLIQDAIDFVVDPVRTARTKISDLDNVEKTFIGLKIEHFFRDFLDVPKGVRDLVIDDVDVDVKNTVGAGWTIPPETYQNSDPVVLVMVADEERQCSLGLFVARREYMRKATNRDAKLGLRSSSWEHIWWLVHKAPLPDSRWAGVNMERFRELRAMKGGNKRAAQFFRENLRAVVHRSIIQALLFDQLDYMKRIRGNGGAKDILFAEEIAILSGKYSSKLIGHFQLPPCGEDEFVAVRFRSSDLAVLQTYDYLKSRDG